MKTNKTVRLLYASLLALGVLSACAKTEELRPSSIVGAEEDVMTFEAQQAEPQTLPVYSDGTWTMECDADWITLDKMEGSGNTEVTVSVTDNIDGNGVLDFPREAKLVFKAGLEHTGKGYSVTVKQAGNKYKGVDDITVTDALGLEDNRVAQIPTSTVVAVATEAFVISDGTSNITVYGTAGLEVKVGDTVKLTGDKQTTDGVPSIAIDAELFEVTATDGSVKYPEPKVLADVDEYESAACDYIQLTGSLVGTQLRFAGKEKRLNVILAPASFKLDEYNIHKITVNGYYAGTSDGKSHNIIITSVTDLGYDESVAPYPVVWAIGDGAKAAGVLNYSTDSFAATNSLESIKGVGYISYIPACDPALNYLEAWDMATEMKTLVDNGNDKFKRDISANNPRIQGTWPGDFWLFKGDGAIKAGSKVQIKFESRVSATNHKFWQLEYFDGDHWKVAGELYESDETGSKVTYTHAMASDGSTNIKINTTVTFNHNSTNCLFRFRCMANWPANGQGPLAARNGGTGRLAVTDVTDAGVEWWPSITIVEQGDGVDRPDVDPVMANIITTPDYLAFEGKPAEAKKITITSDYDFTVESTVDWITLDVTSGAKGEKTVVNVTCAESTLSTLREGKLVISSADSKRTIPVIQSAAGQEVDPMISIDGNHKSVTYKGQSVKVKVQSTVDYTVTSDVDWISLTPLTKTLINKDEVTLYILENASETESRTGHVTFANEENGIESVLTVEQGTHPSVSAIFEDDFSWLAPFIAQYAELTPGKKTGDTIGEKNKSANAPNVYSAAPFNTEEFLKAFTDKGWTDLNPGEKLIYAQDAYLKFSRTGGHNTAIQLSLEKYMKAKSNIVLSFDYAMMIQGDGTVDEGPVSVVIDGDGTFADGSKVASFTSAQQKDELFWNKATASINGATSNTKLTFVLGRAIQEDGSYKWNVSGAGRFFLDNVVIVPGTSNVVFEEDFAWLEPFNTKYAELTPGKKTGDTIGEKNKSANAPNVYSAAPFNTEEFLKAFTDKGWTDLNPGEKLIYAQDAYLKFSRTGGHNTAIQLSLEKYVSASSELELTFDYAMMIQGDGTVDEGPVSVVIDGDGTFADGSKVASFTSAQQKDELFWNKATASINGATSNTKLTFVLGRAIQEDGSYKWNVSGAGRFFLDNIVLTRR